MSAMSVGFIAAQTLLQDYSFLRSLRICWSNRNMPRRNWVKGCRCVIVALQHSAIALLILNHTYGYLALEVCAKGSSCSRLQASQ